MLLQAFRGNLIRRSLPAIASSYAPTLTATSSSRLIRLENIKKTSLLSSQWFSSTATDDLSAIIERELSEEEENAGMPPTLNDLKSTIEIDWSIVDSPPGSTSSSATVKMYRKAAGPSGAKVVVYFHCQDTLIDETKDHNIMEDEADDQEEEEPAAFRFRVTVERAGRTMVFGCVSDEGEATIESLVIRDGEYKEDGDYPEVFYQGPEFSELAEDLQETLAIFLQDECGIDGDVASFVSMYSDYKEQTEYINWLKSIKSLTS